ncbi:hypothetical protein [Sphingomonas abaci]|uniref:Cell division protein FtsB n=1 Tax=Sphingomonas abaci TaxID=237611 RepID=A0A7W7AH50_9SPHN|nr:hypothetical protein [Sphingomonas abaci]MBB4616200.1 cell division protein FtsB [Sphingomonas abaci]
MLFTTPTQFAVLGLVLVAGWLLGLASHPGGGKWKQRYAAERDAHAAHRKDVEARLATAETRNAELEREVERLRTAAPVVTERAPAGTRVVDDAVVADPRQRDRVVPVTGRAASAARPAYPVGERRGWFDFGPRPARRI